MSKTPHYVAKFVILTAIVVIVGWFLDIDIFKRLIPGFVTMKFNTALSFLLSGLLLLSTTYNERNKNQWPEIVIAVSTFIILLLMGTTLLSVIFGYKSGVENLFVTDSAEAILTSVPGQPSLGTLVAFILIGAMGLSAMARYWKKRIRVYKYLGIAVGFIGGIGLLGYLVSIPVFYYLIPGISTAMAIHTAFLFFIIGLGYVSLARE